MVVVTKLEPAGMTGGADGDLLAVVGCIGTDSQAGIVNLGPGQWRLFRPFNMD